MTKRILIISNSSDLHADLMEPVLKQKGSEAFRLNLDKFPKDYAISHEISNRQWQARLRHLPSENAIDLDNVGAAWTRKPGDFSFLSEDLPRQEKFHAEQETRHLLNGLLHSMDCYWINHPIASQSALWKTEQSVRAARMGFKVAPSLVTNEPQAASKFWDQIQGDMVLKSLSSPFLAADKVSSEDRSVSGGLKTTLVTQAHMENIEAVKELPCYFQRYFNKAFELRVTIIGEQVFAAKINSQDNEQTKVDFRDFTADVRYEAYQLPEEIEHKCREFVHSYQLQYGAMDIIVTPEHEYIFLENNPAGQFWFVQQRVPELAMMEALADTLIEGAACH